MDALPSYESFLLPVLEAVEGGAVTVPEVARRAVRRLDLPDEVDAARLPWNGQPVVEARVEQAAVDLAMAGLLERDGDRLAITARGRQVSLEPGRSVDVAFLGQFPEFAAYRAEKLARRGA